MASAYSQDLRDRVLAAGDRGVPTKKVAEVFDVSPAWVRRLKQRRRETGETSPRPMGGATVIKIDMTRLAELVRVSDPDQALDVSSKGTQECAQESKPDHRGKTETADLRQTMMIPIAARSA